MRTKILENKLLIFPLLLLTFVLVLALLKISGTSVGEFNEIFYSPNYKDPNLILGQSRSIRSDEWLVETPLTSSQAKENFNSNNQLIGLGQETAALSNTPTNHWSTVFKPQNWSFFALPFENAFAFKWWLRGFLLILGSYLFLYQLTKKSLFLSISGSLFLFFTPFVQWWYSTTAVECLAYFFFALFAFTKIIEYETKKELAMYTLLLAYVSISFILLLYPPFLVPLTLLGISFCLGFVLNSRDKITKQKLKFYVLSLITILTTIILIIVSYYFSFADVIHVIRNTSYPGTREVFGGGYYIIQLFSGFFNILFQRQKEIPLVWGNASEGSNGLLLPFILPLVLFFILKNYFEKKQLDYILLFLSGFTLVILTWMLIGLPHQVTRGLLLTMSSPGRGIIGLIAANLILIFYFLTKFNISKSLNYKIIAFLISAFTALLYLGLGFYLKVNFPAFNSSNKVILIITLAVFIITLFLLLQKRKLFIFLLLGYSLLSTFLINPVYIGLGALINTKLANTVRQIQQTEKTNHRWVVYDDGILGSYLIANGINSLNSIQLYPQFELWNKFDKNHTYYSVWNRFSHIIFTNNEASNVEFTLNQPDVFTVKVNPCNEAFKELTVEYFVFPYKSNLSCLKEVTTVTSTTPNYYIYKSIDY